MEYHELILRNNREKAEEFDYEELNHRNDMEMAEEMHRNHDEQAAKRLRRARSDSPCGLTEEQRRRIARNKAIALERRVANHDAELAYQREMMIAQEMHGPHIPDYDELLDQSEQDQYDQLDRHHMEALKSQRFQEVSFLYVLDRVLRRLPGDLALDVWGFLRPQWLVVSTNSYPTIFMSGSPLVWRRWLKCAAKWRFRISAVTSTLIVSY
jgi:hypothetical protein